MQIRNCTVEMMPVIFKVDPGAFKAIAVGSNEDSQLLLRLTQAE
jgi:hypothetical protein